MAPRTIGQYRLLGEPIGHGHSAEVFVAKQQRNKSPIAIKLLHEYITDERVKRSFLEEATLIEALDHPGIIKLIDVGFAGPRPYIIMTYASGGSVRKKHAPGSRLPLETIVSYVQQIASALDYAHERKIVHCDVKPENILLDQNNHLLLSDFGTARIVQTVRSLKTQNPFGTPLYMAPEQFQGKSRPASDQYSLGIMVYEWLCGSPPFDGNNFNRLMDQHTCVPVPSLESKDADVPESVERIVQKALDKKPEGRFPDLKTFSQALEQAARKQAALEQAAREQAAREQAALEQAAREQAAQDQAARIQAVLERDAFEQAVQEKAASEQATPVPLPSGTKSERCSEQSTPVAASSKTEGSPGCATTLGIVGALLTIIAIFVGLHFTYDFSNKARTVQGTVKASHQEKSSSSNDDTCSTTVTFTIPNHRTPLTTTDNQCPTLAKGTNVKVYYDPNDPSIAKTERQKQADIDSGKVASIGLPIYAFVILFGFCLLIAYPPESSSDSSDWYPYVGM